MAVELYRPAADDYKPHPGVHERPDDLAFIAVEPWTIEFGFHLPGPASIVRCRKPAGDLLEDICANGKNQSALCYKENEEGNYDRPRYSHSQ